MKGNPLRELNTMGRFIWLGYIRRDLISSGNPKTRIDDDVEQAGLLLATVPCTAGSKWNVIFE